MSAEHDGLFNTQLAQTPLNSTRMVVWPVPNAWAGGAPEAEEIGYHDPMLYSEAIKLPTPVPAGSRESV